MKTILTLLLGAGVLAGTALAQPETPVTVTESPNEYILANRLMTARVLKRSGDLASLKYRDAEMLNDKSGHAGAYWSHDTTGGTELVSLSVTVNGQPAGKIDRLLVDRVITRHSIRGLWYEREVAFDAALLKPGANVLTLTVPAGPVNNGVIYDYLRLELDDNP